MHETETERLVREAQFVTGFIRAVNARRMIPDVEAALRYRRSAKSLTWAVEDYCKSAPTSHGID
jgi:hypothetical protein